MAGTFMGGDAEVGECDVSSGRGEVTSAPLVFTTSNCSSVAEWGKVANFFVVVRFQLSSTPGAHCAVLDNSNKHSYAASNALMQIFAC